MSPPKSKTPQIQAAQMAPEESIQRKNAIRKVKPSLEPLTDVKPARGPSSLIKNARNHNMPALKDKPIRTSHASLASALSGEDKKGRFRSKVESPTRNPVAVEGTGSNRVEDGFEQKYMQ